ncbi:MAG: hypothetical protein AAF465_02995 [Pseudomonadota bacterium]
MRALILLIVVGLAGCQPAPSQSNAPFTNYVGDWYSIRPNGVTTLHSNTTFFADGTMTIDLFTCLSSELESAWTDRGEWYVDDNGLHISVISDENNAETYHYSYVELSAEFDQRWLRDTTYDTRFKIWRRWHETPYTCATSLEDIAADRDRAIADGRFQQVYPDYNDADRDGDTS